MFNATCTFCLPFFERISTVHAGLYTCNDALSNMAGLFIYMYQIIHEISFSNLAGFLSTCTKFGVTGGLRSQTVD